MRNLKFQLEQYPIPAATAAAMAQSLFLPFMSSGSTPAQQAAMLSLLAMPGAGTSSPTTRVSATTTANKTSTTEAENNGNDVLNLSTKKVTEKAGTSSSGQGTSAPSDHSAMFLNNLNLTEVLALANLPAG